MGGMTVLLIWQGIPFALAGQGEQAPALNIAMTWVYLAIPVTSIASAVFVLELVLGGAADRGNA
jgi:TRAP-type C4-dicarboxylate transport system permease small subunit